MRRLLVRDFIQRSLYHPIHGYFSSAASPVLNHTNHLRLTDIASAKAYHAAVAQVYASQQHGWLTPVELFSPFFSHAVANRLERALQTTDTPVNIIEIGAGRATLASDVLNLWSRTNPDLLARVTYNIIEISSPLAALQSKVLDQWIKSGHAVVHNAHCLEWFSGLNRRPTLRRNLQHTHCHIIAMEVLDNLPHDLVRETEGQLQQAHVLLDDKLGHSLQWSTHIDNLTREAIQAHGILSTGNPHSLFNALQTHFEKLISAGSSYIWVPTVFYQLLREITQALPHASITLADFHSLPGASSGHNGPIVQRIERGTAVVYDSFHSAPFGKVDIMFPTDFNQLHHAYRTLSRDGTSTIQRILSQQDFFRQFSSDEDKVSTTCQDGFNPIIDDFKNASVFLVNGTSESS